MVSAHDYIAQDNPAAAKEFFRYLLSSTERLTEFPQTGRAGRVPGTRELVLVKYPFIVPYRIEGSEIQILHVLHSARNLPTALPPR